MTGKRKDILTTMKGLKMSETPTGTYTCNKCMKKNLHKINGIEDLLEFRITQKGKWFAPHKCNAIRDILPPDILYMSKWESIKHPGKFRYQGPVKRLGPVLTRPPDVSKFQENPSMGLPKKSSYRLVGVYTCTPDWKEVEIKEDDD